MLWKHIQLKIKYTDYDNLLWKKKYCKKQQTHYCKTVKIYSRQPIHTLCEKLIRYILWLITSIWTKFPHFLNSCVWSNEFLIYFCFRSFICWSHVNKGWPQSLRIQLQIWWPRDTSHPGLAWIRSVQNYVGNEFNILDRLIVPRLWTGQSRVWCPAGANVFPPSFLPPSPSPILQNIWTSFEAYTPS